MSLGVVLVVDDEPASLAVVSRALPSRRAVLLVALDASEALEVLRSGVAVDLIVADLRGAGDAGRELVAAVSERHPGAVLAAVWDDLQRASFAGGGGARPIPGPPSTRELEGHPPADRGPRRPGGHGSALSGLVVLHKPYSEEHLGRLLGRARGSTGAGEPG